MADLSFAEVSTASRNAMLSAKVRKALHQVRRNNALGERERGMLTRGATLLSDVVQGSLLIERKPLEEHGSRADLKAYSHAISALEMLKLSATDKDVTDVFKTYRSDLITLSEGGVIPNDRLEKLESFFALLNEFFFRDVQKVPPTVQADPVLAMLP